MWHAADDGGEHQGGDEGEEDQVNEALHPVIAQPGHRLDVVLKEEEKQHVEPTREVCGGGGGGDATHHVQTAAVHQRGQLVEPHLGGVQHRLDLLKVGL